MCSGSQGRLESNLGEGELAVGSSQASQQANTCKEGTPFSGELEACRQPNLRNRAKIIHLIILSSERWAKMLPGSLASFHYIVLAGIQPADP